MSDAMLYEKFKGVCLSEREYQSLEDTGEIPRWLITCVGGIQNLSKNKSSAGKYTGKFTDAIRKYDQLMFLEEDKPLGCDYEQRICMNLFRNILVFSITPGYDADKKRYETMVPLVKPVAIPLVKVTSGKTSSVVDADGTTRYLFTVSFTDGSAYRALLFTEKDGEISMDHNWSLAVNSDIYSDVISGEVLAKEEIAAYLEKLENVFEKRLEERFDFEQRRGILKLLFEEPMCSELATGIYATADGFADMIIDHLDKLAYTQIARDLNREIKPHLDLKKEALKKSQGYRDQFDKNRRKLWGAGLVRQRRMKPLLLELQENAKKEDKRAMQEQQISRDICLEIIDKM
ncbi:hypothetical protein [Eubacterium oxidoreducens]|uniref:Uncharacterized protein n=1 Tax=Eubacterium oxidoreducens TaxID=1732 RepID=A0A1G6B6V9_EUBOX|nr:hypothetical protein [Eubacterium oxidoreducens]SDB16351.1 hypothetical protein SAMN02910417_01246 [Eubacterium oxidoreducens]